MSKSTYYILNEDGTVTGTDDLREFGRFMATDRRILAKDQIKDAEVSTVFLGLDHGLLLRSSEPILFETMIFGGAWDQKQWRYTSLAAARNGHTRVVNALAEGVDPTERAS